MLRAVGSGVAAIVVAVLLLPSLAGLAVALGVLVFLAVVAVWNRSVARRVDALVELPDRLVHGEETDLVVVVQNRSRWPAARVRVEVQLPPSGFTPGVVVLDVALPGRRARRVTTPVKAFARGGWEPAPPRLTVSDPWGIESLEVTGSRPARVTVLPAVLPVRRIELPAAAPLAELPDVRALTTDPNAIVGVRPYQPGDPLRSIHWPATAATGTLVRRETERAWARDLVVALDLSRDGWEHGEEHAAEVAVTVAASLLVDAVLGARQPAGLVVSLPGGAGVARFRIDAGRTHLDAMLVHLATVRLHPGVALPELLRRHVRHHQPGTTVAVVTGRITDEVADAVAQLRRGGQAVVAVQVGGPRVLDAVAPVRTGGAPRVTVQTGQPLDRLRL